MEQGSDFDYDANHFNFNKRNAFSELSCYHNLVGGIECGDSSPPPPIDPSSHPSFASTSSPEDESHSPSDDGDFADTCRYISHVLMEEDMDDKPCMFYDALTLQAAERSLYAVISEKHPSSSTSNQEEKGDSNHSIECSEDSLSDIFSDFGKSGIGSSDYSVDCQWNSVTHFDYKPSIFQAPFSANFVFQSSSISNGKPHSVNFTNTSATDSSHLVSASISELLESNPLIENDSILQFKRGMEEASKFLPSQDPLIIDLEKETSSLAFNRREFPAPMIKTEKDEKGYLPEFSRKKNHERQDDDSYSADGRSNKQSAIYVEEENELSKLFERVLICSGENEKHPVCILERDFHDEPEMNKKSNKLSSGSSEGKNRAKKSDNKKAVDLSTMLVLCAQAISSDDRRTAREHLKQIKQNSSPFGDGYQRLAFYFANALEARLDGTGAQIYTTLASKRNSAADVIKAYQMYITACPFLKLSIIFANHIILNLSMEAETIHILDFGILYGFQWPALIQRLSYRPGGPPKLRITGIDLPQSGFRPAERVHETGRRLASYCARFNVPFEYNAIAQKWETIRVEDLKLNQDEFLVVNCQFRMRHLPDESVVLNSPRDAVLNLIGNIKPNIFTQGIVNGSYSAPFFVTRFREALFHYSSLFDMLDTNIGREDPMRLMFEKEFYGREIVNIIACEGLERVERPETYKQWQIRTARAGFRQLPLHSQLMKKAKHLLRYGFHSDFVLDQDGFWMLQGWKGRIVNASTVWVPI